MKACSVLSASLAAVLTTTAPAASAQSRAPTCEDLVWSAQVLAANPDIRNACQGVYVRNNKLYAKVNIELLRVSGNRLTFQTRWTDGGTGKARSITVPASWRVALNGSEPVRHKEELKFENVKLTQRSYK